MLKYLALLSSLLLISCIKEPMKPQVQFPTFVYAGGETTIFDATSTAFTNPASNLSTENLAKHLTGDLTFEQIFVTEPASINPGLGPIFNNNSCVSCHIRNGRSKPSFDGDEISGMLLRISIPGESLVGGPKPVPNFGTQLQTRSIFESEREASFSSQEIFSMSQFLDGTEHELVKNNYSLTQAYQNLPTNVLISPRVAPPVFGLGLLESIPESNILDLADENDEDNDGISGRINWVWNHKTNNYERGIFGWKAEMPTAELQTAEAYHQDMGITSIIFPLENCVQQDNCQADDQIDLLEEQIQETTFYFQTLAVPAVRNHLDEKFLAGQELFYSTSCDKCHTPNHFTGEALIPELSNQQIFPYTDLLLHDMGEGLTDKRPSYTANGSEWRTPPLWGIGLTEIINGHTRYLHDGRARNIEEAILWHGGEAQDSQTRFRTLTKDQRENLIYFVKSI